VGVQHSLNPHIFIYFINYMIIIVIKSGASLPNIVKRSVFMFVKYTYTRRETQSYSLDDISDVQNGTIT